MIGRWVGRIGYVVGSDRFFWGMIALLAGIDLWLCAAEGAAGEGAAMTLSGIRGFLYRLRSMTRLGTADRAAAKAAHAALTELQTDLDLNGPAADICVDRPEARAEAFEAGNTTWPEGYWGVSDGNHGYIAYFQHESDARGFREWLINCIQNGRATARRYEVEP